MIALESSNLAGVDYDETTCTLVVVFHNGGVYEFSHVPSSDYEGLISADSPGRYFHQHLKDRFSFKKIV